MADQIVTNAKQGQFDQVFLPRPQILPPGPYRQYPAWYARRYRGSAVHFHVEEMDLIVQVKFCPVRFYLDNLVRAQGVKNNP
jgi:hypothetical protein